MTMNVTSDYKIKRASNKLIDRDSASLRLLRLCRLFESRVPGLFVVVIVFKLQLAALEDLGGAALEHVAMLLFVGNLRFEHVAVEIGAVLGDDTKIDVGPGPQIVHDPAQNGLLHHL